MYEVYLGNLLSSYASKLTLQAHFLSIIECTRQQGLESFLKFVNHWTLKLLYLFIFLVIKIGEVITNEKKNLSISKTVIFMKDETMKIQKDSNLGVGKVVFLSQIPIHEKIS